MSNIGKQPIYIPENTEVKITSNNISVKGKLGELAISFNPVITVKNENNCIQIVRKSDKSKDRELHGLYRALMFNMVKGVSEGFKKELKLVGVGYSVENKGDYILINIGFMKYLKEL